MESQTASASPAFRLFDVKSEFLLRNHRYIVFLLPAISFLLWTISLVQAKSAVMGDYGMFSVLPVTFYLSVFLLLASMFYTMFGPKTDIGMWGTCALLFQSFLLMVFILFTPSLVEGFARSPHSWIKYGYVDYIVRNGHIDQAITHYHNWPIPFIFSAKTVMVTGISPTTFPLLFPLVLDVVLFAVVCLFFFRLFKENWLRFMGILLFFLITWENQFHFAPQFFGFVLFIIVMYLLVFHLKRENPKILAVTGLMFMVLIMTHLLTAFVASLFLGILVLYQILWPKKKERKSVSRRRMKVKWLLKKRWWKLYFRKVVLPRFEGIMANKRKLMFLAVIAFGALVVWFTFAQDWVRYANYSIDAGLIKRLFTAYLDKLYTGSAAHGNLALLRMAFTAAVGVLALIAAKMAFDRERVRVMFIIIFSAAVPIFMFYYGVEIVQRAFLFCGLPLAVLCAMALDRKKFLAVVLVFAFLSVPVHILAHYGNEKVDYTPPSQVEGAEFVFAHLPEKSVVLSGNPVDRSQMVEKYRRIVFSDLENFEETRRNLYVVYSSSNEYFLLWYHGNEGRVNDLKSVVGGEDYIKIFDSPDCQIYKYSPIGT